MSYTRHSTTTLTSALMQRGVPADTALRLAQAVVTLDDGRTAPQLRAFARAVVHGNYTAISRLLGIRYDDAHDASAVLVVVGGREFLQ